MTKATVYYNGLVVWQPPAVYKSSCAIDVEYFPYDVQTCVLKLGSWTYDGFKVTTQITRLPLSLFSRCSDGPPTSTTSLFYICSDDILPHNCHLICGLEIHSQLSCCRALLTHFEFYSLISVSVFAAAAWICF